MPAFETDEEGNQVARRPYGAYDFASYARIPVDVDGNLADIYRGLGNDTAWADASLNEGYPQDWLQPDTAYSLGIVCIDPSNSQRVVAGTDGTTIAVWGTFTTDATGANYTFSAPKKASSATLTATNSGPYAATLTATVPTDATGEVEFFEGTTSLGKKPVEGGGKATLNLTGLSVGAHSYTVTYLGDGAYNASPASDARSVTIEFVKLDSTVVLTSVLKGEDAATLTATIKTGTETATGATGEVEFFQGSTSLGKIAATDGVATLELSDLTAAKTHSFTAAYLGDTTYNASPASSATEVKTPVAPVELKKGDKATPGARYYVDAPEGTFEDGDAVNGVVTSDPIALTETATAATDGSVRFVFTLPTALASSTEAAHTLTLTGTPSSRAFAVAFTIDPTPKSGAGAPQGSGTNAKGLATTGQDGAALFLTLGLGAGALALGGGALGTGRFLRRRNEAA